MVERSEHIVIFQQIVTVPDLTNPNGYRFATTYHWPDRKLHTTRDRAISAGFNLRGSDDFNVATVVNSEISWFGWMDKRLDGYDLPEIADQIGLRSI